MRKYYYIMAMAMLAGSPVYAVGSTGISPQASLQPYHQESYIDTQRCSTPIQSSPYVIVAGNGGANMNLHCPADKPVMYGWRQQVGFGGIFSVQAGGGRSWITCCAMNHRWVRTETSSSQA